MSYRSHYSTAVFGCLGILQILRAYHRIYDSPQELYIQYLYFVLSLKDARNHLSSNLFFISTIRSRTVTCPVPSQVLQSGCKLGSPLQTGQTFVIMAREIS